MTASFLVDHIYLNNLGDLSFVAILDTDVDGDGVADTGLFVRSGGVLRRVAGTGTVIPGVGKIEKLSFGGQAPITPPGVNSAPFLNGLAVINDRGQVVFGGTLEDGRGVLLVATPTP